MMSLLLAFFLVLSAPAAGAADPFPEAALQNPVLRSHFRRIAVESRAVILPDGRRVYRRDYFLEDRVEHMVRGFLNELVERRSGLSQAAETSRLARERALRRNSNREARLVLQASLRELAKRAGKLRSILKPVLADFDTKASEQPRIEGAFANSGFEAEMEFLMGEVEGSLDLIESTFFQPSHTVDARSLENGNMLVRLYRVKALAEALAEQIP